MGWWKCNENGGIDWGNKPSGHDGGLINAIPNRDTTEDYYNGDSPADAMYVPIAILKSWFVDKPKPNKDQLVKLFTEKVFDDGFSHIDRQKLEELVDVTWKEINEIYKDEWSRPIYPEEKYFVCSFSFGGAAGYTDRMKQTPSQVRQELRDWWTISKLDKTYIKKYNEGKWPYWWRTS